MDDTTKKLLSAFYTFLNYDQNPGCHIEDEETLNQILAEKTITDKDIDDLLLKIPPRLACTIQEKNEDEDEAVPVDNDLSSLNDDTIAKLLSLKACEINPSVRDLSTGLPDLTTLVTGKAKLENGEIAKKESITKSDKPYSVPQPTINNEDELGRVKITINHSKLQYMVAQNHLLQYYIRFAVEGLDKPDPPVPGVSFKKDFLKTYPYANRIVSDFQTVTIQPFLDKMPCSFQDINFLYTILKKDERNASKM